MTAAVPQLLLGSLTNPNNSQPTDTTMGGPDNETTTWELPQHTRALLCDKSAALVLQTLFVTEDEGPDCDACGRPTTTPASIQGRPAKSFRVYYFCAQECGHSICIACIGDREGWTEGGDSAPIRGANLGSGTGISEEKKEVMGVDITPGGGEVEAEEEAVDEDDDVIVIEPEAPTTQSIVAMTRPTPAEQKSTGTGSKRGRRKTKPPTASDSARMSKSASPRRSKRLQKKERERERLRRAALMTIDDDEVEVVQQKAELSDSAPPSTPKQKRRSKKRKAHLVVTPEERRRLKPRPEVDPDFSNKSNRGNTNHDPSKAVASPLTIPALPTQQTHPLQQPQPLQQTQPLQQRQPPQQQLRPLQPLQPQQQLQPLQQGKTASPWAVINPFAQAKITEAESAAALAELTQAVNSAWLLLQNGGLRGKSAEEVVECVWFLADRYSIAGGRAVPTHNIPMAQLNTFTGGLPTALYFNVLGVPPEQVPKWPIRPTPSTVTSTYKAPPTHRPIAPIYHPPAQTQHLSLVGPNPSRADHRARNLAAIQAQAAEKRRLDRKAKEERKRRETDRVRKAAERKAERTAENDAKNETTVTDAELNAMTARVGKKKRKRKKHKRNSDSDSSKDSDSDSDSDVVPMSTGKAARAHITKHRERERKKAAKELRPRSGIQFLLSDYCRSASNASNRNALNRRIQYLLKDKKLREKIAKFDIADEPLPLPLVQAILRHCYARAIATLKAKEDAALERERRLIAEHKPVPKELTDRIRRLGRRIRTLYADQWRVTEDLFIRAQDSNDCTIKAMICAVLEEHFDKAALICAEYFVQRAMTHFTMRPHWNAGSKAVLLHEKAAQLKVRLCLKHHDKNGCLDSECEEDHPCLTCFNPRCTGPPCHFRKAQPKPKPKAPAQPRPYGGNSNNKKGGRGKKGGAQGGGRRKRRNRGGARR